MEHTKDKKPFEAKPQSGNDIQGLPIKNAMTDPAKNAATQAPGLNQEKTTRDDMLPSDGDNLTQ